MIDTKEIDFTGCNEDVAVALSCGKQILCEVGNGQVDWIICYTPVELYQYIGLKTTYKDVVPVKDVVKKKRDILNWFVDNNWKCQENDHWYAPETEDLRSVSGFNDKMFNYCEKIPGGYFWRPEWLEQNTKDIDYTGCDVEIAKALRCGKQILCEITKNKFDWIIGFAANKKIPYIMTRGRVTSASYPHSDEEDILKSGGHCYNSLGFKMCSFSVAEGPVHMCKLFNVEKPTSRSLIICDKVYGPYYEGRV